MPQSRKHWGKGRKASKIRPVRRILILCEDEKSSRDYFAYRDTGLGRTEIYAKLSTRLGGKYDKADTNIYDALEPKIETALRNAKRLAFENVRIGVPTRNPSTQVHKLVESLRQLADIR